MLGGVGLERRNREPPPRRKPFAEALCIALKTHVLHELLLACNKPDAVLWWVLLGVIGVKLAQCFVLVLR
jgi:hypothetical protein